MRFALGVAIAVGAVGTAVAAGRVVRVEAPPEREVIIPAGWFTMGVDENAAQDALGECSNTFPSETFQLTRGGQISFCPDFGQMLAAMAPRDVYLSAFAIDRDEVSVRDYRACVAAGHCTLDALVAGDERYVQDGWPMVNVTWAEAQTFCQWHHGRLPTEAEWERAARGPEPSALWPWGRGEQPNDFNHGKPRASAMREIDRSPEPTPTKYFGDPDDSDGHALVAPPGTFAWGESPEGVRDMAGNVAEWTADAFVLEQPTTERDTTIEGYIGLESLNPVREGKPGDPRIVRGGSWRQPAFVAQSNLRDPFSKLYEPQRRFSHVGFRCARSVR